MFSISFKLKTYFSCYFNFQFLNFIQIRTMFVLNDNNKIPNVLFGTYLITDEKVLEDCIEKALSSGYRGIDTASVYRNESFIGKILKKKLQKFGLKREDIFITTKLAPADQGYENAKNAILKSLNNLELDYLDLYIIHWPGTSKMDKESPAQLDNRKGSWKALEEAQANGLIRSIGVSNYMIKHLKEMENYSKSMPVVNQVECHPYLNQSELVSYCRAQNIHFQAYSSLGTSQHHLKLMENETIQKLSKELNKSPAQILLKWAVNQGFSVLPKSTNLDHIEQNIQLLDWQLSDSQMEEIFSINKNERFCWNPNTVA